MTRRTIVILALVVLAAASLAGVARLRKDRTPSLPTAVVAKGTFIDYLQLRGEIRPIQSVILTAPSSGADLQIIEIAKNGALVNPGDVVVQFDPTTQQRTLEQKQSELKQAESEIAKAEANLQKAEKNGSDTVETRYLRALILYKQNKNAEALAGLDQLKVQLIPAAQR